MSSRNHYLEGLAMLHIVTGAPCSGKSTYVREHAQAGDVIVDFDLIAQALGSDTPHASDGAIRAATFAARTALINHLVDAKNVEAWIIHTSPCKWQLDAYEKAVAEIIELDTDLETCLQRAREDNRPEGTEDAIRAYFAEHEKGGHMATLYKDASTEPTIEDGGIVKGYASTFDRDPDAYGDVVAPGAFKNTLARWAEIGKPIPLLYGHSVEDPKYNIGAVTEAREDERGLYIEARFDAENETAQQVRKLVREGRLYQFSFAYEVLNAAPVELEDGRKANELRELNIFEVSLVQIPANQHAEVTEIKDANTETKGADMETKAGRRLSKATEDALNEAAEAIRDAQAQTERALAIVVELIGAEQSTDENEEEQPIEDEPTDEAQTSDDQVDEKAAILELYKQTIAEIER